MSLWAQLPLCKEAATVLRAWLAIRSNKVFTPELFLNVKGGCMTRSGFKYILSKHVKQPSLERKLVLPIHCDIRVHNFENQQTEYEQIPQRHQRICSSNKLT